MNVVTIDIGSKFLSYALWNDEQLVRVGKIYLQDDNYGYFSVGILTEFAEDKIDAFVYEAPFFGANIKTTMLLSQIVGCIMSGFYMLGVDTYKSVPPITWQTGLGVTKTSTKDMLKLKEQNPRRSASFIKNLDRQNRKQKVIDLVNRTYDLKFTIDENDLADAVGIGMYVIKSGMKLK